MSTKIKSGSLSPYLTVNGAHEAIAFYEEVFGAKLTGKMMADDEKRILHASLMIGGSLVMLSDEFLEHGGHAAPDRERGTAVAIGIELEEPQEVDRIYNLALKKGGTESSPPEDMFWGDRFAQFHDIKGHRWMLTSPLADT